MVAYSTPGSQPPLRRQLRIRARTGIIHDPAAGGWRVVVTMTCPDEPDLDETRVTDHVWASEAEAEAEAHRAAKIITTALDDAGVEVSS